MRRGEVREQVIALTEQGKSILEIVTMLQVSRSTVGRCRRDSGVEVPGYKKTLPAEIHNQRMEYHQSGMTDGEIAKLEWVTREAIRYWRIENGLEPNKDKSEKPINQPRERYRPEFYAGGGDIPRGEPIPKRRKLIAVPLLHPGDSVTVVDSPELDADGNERVRKPKIYAGQVRQVTANLIVVDVGAYCKSWMTDDIRIGRVKIA